MRLLKAASYPVMPWKNGGGETWEIAASPPGASLDDFAWRVSMARVDRDGPFSMFVGIDRTLTIISGAMMLLPERREAVALDATAPPYGFDGGEPIGAIVTQGPVIDLNVMTRRTCYRHHVCRETGSGGRASIVAADVMLVVALGDGLRAGGTPLGRHDCLVLAAGDTPDLTIDTGTASSEGAMVSIELWRLR